MSAKEPLSSMLKSFVENPRKFQAWLDEHNPWLARQVLSAASNIVDPYLAGMGMMVEELNDTRCEILLPWRWKNKSEGGAVHVGAVVTAAEFASRQYWARVLNLQRNSMRVLSVSSRFLSELRSDAKAVFDFSESEREAALFRLRSEGEASVPCAVNVFDDGGKLVAEVSIEWHLHQPKMLGGK